MMFSVEAPSAACIRWIFRHALKFLVVCCLLTLIAAGSALAQTQYGSPVKVAPFTQPGSVNEMAILDMNGDGLDDILAASLYFPLQNLGIPIQILLNDGNGGFFDGTAQVINGPVPSTVHPRKVVVADFNGDGKLDVFIADHGVQRRSLSRRAEHITLVDTGWALRRCHSQPAASASILPTRAAAADIDGSGRVAIYAGNIYGQQNIGPSLLFERRHRTLHDQQRSATARTDQPQPERL